eukprot:3760344-Rhodomonas_salina.2
MKTASKSAGAWMCNAMLALLEARRVGWMIPFAGESQSVVLDSCCTPASYCTCAKGEIRRE